MKWISVASRAENLHDALGQCIDELRAGLGVEPDLAFVFVSEQHRAFYGTVPGRLARALPQACIVGCSASGVIGGGHEIENGAAVAITAASLPGVGLRARWLRAGDLPPADGSMLRWQSVLGVAASEVRAFVILADPFGFPTEQFVSALERTYPAAVKIGGLASGMQAPREGALYVDGEVRREGAVCLALSGDVEIETRVAQGCRPIGQPMFVTRSLGSRLLALDGQPPLAVLESLYRTLPERDRELLQHSLFLGIAMRPAGQEYRQGDFLIRNLVGAERDSGALLVGADLSECKVVQFHLRDAQTSAYDIDRVLADLAPAGRTAAGALLFSCTGRGERLYRTPDHDSGVLRRYAGELPLGGFFCNGEIGPVGGTAFLHGYTSAFGIFRARG
ncbi:MAG: FIST N-terminal domain-containing protein [Gammaproteobacteria bacterium]